MSRSEQRKDASGGFAVGDEKSGEINCPHVLAVCLQRLHRKNGDRNVIQVVCDRNLVKDENGRPTGGYYTSDLAYCKQLCPMHPFKTV